MNILIDAVKYGTVSTHDNATERYYIVYLASSPQKMQYETIVDGQIISYGERV